MSEPIVYVLPHVDPSIRLVAPGYQVQQLHLTAWDRLAEAAARNPPAPADPAERALLAAAGAAFESQAHLAAQAALVALAGRAHRWPVRLRLDDLELATGSTESADDVLRAVDGLPFADECRQVAGPAIVWVDRDQQLPALAALARRITDPVTLAGPFARDHWPVLRTWLPPGSELVELAAHWESATAAPVRWLSRSGDGHAWLDTATAPEVGDAVAVPAGCVGLILGLAAADAGGVVTSNGDSVSWSAVAALTCRAPVLAEFWLAAPGETARSCMDSAARIAQADLPWRIAGCRPFHLTSSQWAGRPVPLLPQDATLPRGVRYAAADLSACQADLIRLLRRRGRLAPARTASAYLDLLRQAGEPALAPGVLAPGVVVSKADGDFWLVDLAAARTIRLDPRIGTRLIDLPPGAPLPAAVVRLLAGAGVLTAQGGGQRR